MQVKECFKDNIIETGRGATAIYLALRNEKIENKDVLVPGNICYAAVYPIIFSNNNPIFCDVEVDSGNINLSLIKTHISKNTKAILIPHMYGNTINELKEIKLYCEKNGLVLIEDCASSFGGNNKKYGSVGKIGDYVIHSFGYSKIIDLGNGGILTSNKNLDLAKNELNKLPYYDDDISELESQLSTTYRNIRNNHLSYETIKSIDFKKILLYKLKTPIVLNDDDLNERINTHINNYCLFDTLLDKKLKRYKYNEGSIPWRFSLIVEKSIKEVIIHKLLENKLPVSDWYPNVTEFFNDKKIYLNNVDIMEEHIINLPLDINKTRIKRICEIINEVQNV